jgi:homoserine kinase type II
LFRAAFEDEAGGLFVLEQIAPAQRERKRFIREILDQLQADGLKQVLPYIRTLSGESPTFCDGAWWQVSPFIAGTPLDRPGYIRDAGKGKALARFLGDLSRHAKNLSLDGGVPGFSLKDYILKLEKEMARHDPEAGRRFASVLDFLRRSFMDAHDTLPVAFCHGDYHPLNVIWQGDAITAVIDWEFCGLKPDIYDIANLVGCIGMEHPSGLTGNLVMAFIEGMRQTPTVSTRSWDLLTEFIIALRFAWLAEWLRAKDKEMIDLEEIYMNLLVRSSDSLKETWEI